MAESAWRITADEKNSNNLRIHGPGGQLCKVYGFDPEQARERANMIVAALEAAVIEHKRRRPR